VPQSRILILGTNEDCAGLISVLDAGASGYLTRSSPLAELIEATRVIHRGDTLIPPRMLGPLLNTLLRRKKQQDEAYGRLAKLTRREREVLALLVDGANNEDIARILFISTQTARTHIQNILTKLSVHSRLEAAAFVRGNGVVLEPVAAHA
jgi:two-component system nitrate/nitrite response regulator NarL